MKTCSLPVIAILIVALAACSTTLTKDISIETNADPKANFSGYKSYTWLGSATIVNDSYGQWEPPAFDADAEVKYLIDRELRARGMLENSSTPDLIVGYAAGINMNALGVKMDPEANQEMLDNVPQGSLVIVLVDSDSGFIIWTGTATAEIQKDADAEMIKARLDYAITRMLKSLPK